RGAAADAQLEAAPAVADARDVGDVVDAGDRAILVGRREGGLDLAWEQLRLGVPDEVANVGSDVGRRVEQLALADAGPRVAGDVAYGVPAAFAAGEVDLGALADELRRVGQRHGVAAAGLPV